MKKVIFIVICLIMVALLWFVVRERGEENPVGYTASTNVGAVNLPKLRGVQSTNASRIGKRSDHTFELFGRIVDEEGTPVEGVVVTFSVRSWPLLRQHPLGEPKFVQDSIISDSDGTFAVKDMKGDSLSIDSLVKDGYAQAIPRLGSVSADQAELTRSNPVVFVVVRQNVSVAERLEMFRFVFKLPADGTPVYFDLEKSRADVLPSEADIKVSFEPVLPDGTTRSPYSWHAHFEALDGGFSVENQDTSAPVEYMQNQMVRAPDVSYVPSFKISKSQANPNLDTKVAAFYFRINGGKQYGKAYAIVKPRTSGKDALLVLEGMLNPFGSAKLQIASGHNTRLP